MAFLTTAVNSVYNSVVSPLVYVKTEVSHSLSVIIGVMDEECCIICSESFENNLDPAIQ